MADQPLPIGTVLRIPIDHVHPGPNARGDLGDLTELAMSIQAIGQLEPILVHTLGDGDYEVFDGHRRLAASKLVRRPHIDAVVRGDLGPARRIQLQLAMHTGCRGFDPIAEAHALHALVFEHRLRHEDIARAVGKTPNWISQRLALLVLTDAEQQQVRDGRMSLREAAVVVGQRRAQRDGRDHRWSSGQSGGGPGRRANADPRDMVRTATAAPQIHTQQLHCATCRCGGAT